MIPAQNPGNVAPNSALPASSTTAGMNKRASYELPGRARQEATGPSVAMLKVSGRLSGLEAQVKALESERNELAKQLQAKEQECQSCEQEALKLKGQLRAAAVHTEDQLAAMRTQVQSAGVSQVEAVRQLDARKAELQALTAAREEQSAGLRRQVATLQAALATANGQLASYSRAQAQQAALTEALEGELQALRQQVTAIKASLATHHQAMNAHAEHVRQSLGDREALTELLQIRDAALASARKALLEQEQAGAQQQVELLQLRTQLELATKAAAAAEARALAAENTLAHTMKEKQEVCALMAASEKTLGLLRATLHKNSAALTTLTQQVITSQQERDAAVKQAHASAMQLQRTRDAMSMETANAQQALGTAGKRAEELEQHLMASRQAAGAAEDRVERLEQQVMASTLAAATSTAAATPAATASERPVASTHAVTAAFSPIAAHPTAITPTAAATPALATPPVLGAATPALSAVMAANEATLSPDQVAVVTPVAVTGMTTPDVATPVRALMSDGTAAATNTFPDQLNPMQHTPAQQTTAPHTPTYLTATVTTGDAMQQYAASATDCMQRTVQYAAGATEDMQTTYPNTTDDAVATPGRDVMTPQRAGMVADAVVGAVAITTQDVLTPQQATMNSTWQKVEQESEKDTSAGMGEGAERQRLAAQLEAATVTDMQKDSVENNALDGSSYELLAAKRQKVFHQVDVEEVAASTGSETPDDRLDVTTMQMPADNDSTESAVSKSRNLKLVKTSTCSGVQMGLDFMAGQQDSRDSEEVTVQPGTNTSSKTTTTNTTLQHQEQQQQQEQQQHSEPPAVQLTGLYSASGSVSGHLQAVADAVPALAAMDSTHAPAATYAYPNPVPPTFPTPVPTPVPATVPATVPASAPSTHTSHVLAGLFAAFADGSSDDEAQM